jgi:general stress protein YciG
MANNNQGGGRGFAGMDPDRQRQIASKGGKAAHESGHAHEFDSREAAEAGRRGGKAAHGSDRSRDSSGRERDNRGRYE